MSATVRLASRRATRHLGAALAAHLRVGDVVWLEGPLGAGKTFFTRGLLRALGVPDAIPVTSPTFALVHTHQARLPVAHLDLYRLGDGEALTELGIDEALSDSIVVFEWGARFRGSIGEIGLEIRLAPLEDSELGRRAELRGLDTRGRALERAVLADPRILEARQ